MININQDHNIKRSSRVEKALKTIDAALNQYGYTELKLPIYEYYDLLQDTVYNFSDESIIRFMDRNTGKTLVLRPDFTPQICRVVNGIENLILPFRASYKGSVFRSVEKDRGIKSEEHQIGWEIYGEPSLYGDMEIVLTAYDALKKLGLNDFIFSFGDTVFISQLKNLTGQNSSIILKTISERRIHDLKKILNQLNLHEKVKDFLLKLPLAFGSADIIDDLITESKQFNLDIAKRLAEIKKLFNSLQECGINSSMMIFDAAESKGLDYYTGIHFEILHSSYGAILGGGGRYDNLMAKFGKNISACGAALNIDNILDFPICSAVEKSFDYLVCGGDNFKKAIELRKNGASVMFVADAAKKELFIRNYTFKNII